MAPTVPHPLTEVSLADRDPGLPCARLIALDAGLPDIDREAEGLTDFTGAVGQVRWAGTVGSWLVGIGAGAPTDLRSAGGALIRSLAARECEAAQVIVPEDLGEDQVRSLVLGLVLGAHRLTLKTDPPHRVGRVDLLAPAGRAATVATAVTYASATALARDLANHPSETKTPGWLADRAVEVLGSEVDVTVRDEDWLADNGFGGVLAVGSGSSRPPRLIEMAWRPDNADTHLVLVGKGITFDSGGISVKPAEGMHLMRTDMAGSAAVIAAMRAVAALRLPVTVTALVPTAENLLSGSAYRPGDVVRHHDGTTTEVDNTDAEGRMVLADALAYAQTRWRPDLIVDVATLTGAMKVSLGLRTGGLFSDDDDLARRLTEAGAAWGEAWWRMPLIEDLDPDLDGVIADVNQGCGRGAGGIRAALFLRRFIRDVPWAHLDIAGPGRAEKPYQEVAEGATGFAARTLVALVASYARARS